MPYSGRSKDNSREGKDMGTLKLVMAREGEKFIITRERGGTWITTVHEADWLDEPTTDRTNFHTTKAAIKSIRYCRKYLTIGGFTEVK